MLGLRSPMNHTLPWTASAAPTSGSRGRGGWPGPLTALRLYTALSGLIITQRQIRMKKGDISQLLVEFDFLRVRNAVVQINLF
jgi:hypothetical protein